MVLNVVHVAISNYSNIVNESNYILIGVRSTMVAYTMTVEIVL